MKRLMATLLLKRLQSHWLFAAGGVLKKATGDPTRSPVSPIPS